MGQKVNPKFFRINQTGSSWNSVWFSKKSFGQNLREDFLIRETLKKLLKNAGIGKIAIKRTLKEITVIIHTSKPGVIIGHQGANIEKVTNLILRKLPPGKKLKIDIREVKKPNLDAVIVAGNIAEQIEKRVPFKRVLKKVVEDVMQSGAEGVRIQVGGRLNGSEMSRVEWASKGEIPLHTIRAKIDYVNHFAQPTYGKIGIKVWIYKGEYFEKVKDQK